MCADISRAAAELPARDVDKYYLVCKVHLAVLLAAPSPSCNPSLSALLLLRSCSLGQ
jgi:hypothetical protein